MRNRRPHGDHIGDWFQPVRCTWCGGVYDLGKVEVTARYVDCSMWKAPCCGVTVDDRGETGWMSRKDYVQITRAEAEHQIYRDTWGRWEQ